MSRSVLVVLALALAAGLCACSSPNRGTWRGTFDGSVSGTVEFRIGSRGTKLTGKMEGETSGGQPFHADMDGRIRGESFYATLRGSARAELRPIPFTGLMKGELARGSASGDWQAEVELLGSRFQGRWRAAQVTGR